MKGNEFKLFSKKPLVFLCATILLMISILANGQNKMDVEVYSANFKHVAFVTADTTYRFTHAIKQNGSFVFWQDFVDSTYKDEDVFFHQSDGVPLIYKYNYNFITRIDTIKCYVPIEHVEYDCDSLINIRDELLFSYILREIGEPIIMNSKQDMVRVLFPCDEINQCSYFNLLKVKFYGDSATLYKVTISSTDLHGMTVISRDSCQLKRNDIDAIRRQMLDSRSAKNTICRRPGNPWLMETVYNGEYQHSIISLFCWRSLKVKWSIADMPFILMEIGSKRFGRHRFSFCTQNTSKSSKIPW